MHHMITSAPPQASTSNQLHLTSTGTAAPLLITGPSFLPRINHHAPRCANSFLRCARSSSSAASAIRHHAEPQSMPLSSQLKPYTCALMAPPAWPMYMPSYMPRPPTQPPFMQAQFEELARQCKDIEVLPYSEAN